MARDKKAAEDARRVALVGAKQTQRETDGGDAEAAAAEAQRVTALRVRVPRKCAHAALPLFHCARAVRAAPMAAPPSG